MPKLKSGKEAKRVEWGDVDTIVLTSQAYTLSDDTFRGFAMSTVKPVIDRLKEVYYKHGKRVGWNLIVAVGLQLYSMARKGINIDADIARRIARSEKYNIPDNVAIDIYNAVVGAVAHTGVTAPGL